jgi:integrase
MTFVGTAAEPRVLVASSSCFAERWHRWPARLATGGPLDLKNATARHFKSLLTAYYPLPEIRVYDLRHTHVTHLLAAGTPVHVVAKRVGHASAKMTLDVYGHVLSGQDGDAVAKLEAYWAGAA